MTAAPIDPAAIRPGDTGTVRVVFGGLYRGDSGLFVQVRTSDLTTYVRPSDIATHEPAPRASIAPAPQAESSPERGDDQGGNQPDRQAFDYGHEGVR
jgi:hypothetical protein